MVIARHKKAHPVEDDFRQQGGLISTLSTLPEMRLGRTGQAPVAHY